MKNTNAKEVLGKLKGEGNVDKTLVGKGSFSKSGFADLTTALVNDTGFKVTSVDKDGKTVETSISELIRSDLKKTVEMAKYPQKSESDILNTCEISAKGLAEAIPHIVLAQIQAGRKFDLPTQTDMVGSIYLAKNPGKTKTVQVRDIKTKETLGTTTITSKDSIQVRAKSPVPKNLQTKVRKDLNGNVVK
jgi:hypothetical protein